MFWMLIAVFVLGYLLIAFEHFIQINKAATALLMAVFLWVILVFSPDAMGVSHELREHLGEISEILFFLLGAMTIVELVDAHDGFKIITDRIKTRNKVSLLWIIGFITFFLSAILDNLTTTIVMISLMRRLMPAGHERWFFAGIIVIAANAGGAWSPIGDVTTTMLWIGNQISSLGIMKALFLPSLVCLLLPLVVLSFLLNGSIEALKTEEKTTSETTSAFERGLIFSLGIGALVFVPVFKTVTHLPPYMGILLGLSILWIVTECVHRSKNEEDKNPLSVAGVLQKIDTTSILFFLGILLAVSSLATGGVLTQVAEGLKSSLGNVYAINIAIGFLSAIIDNVPLVAGAMKMYPLVSPEQLALAPEQSAWLSGFLMDGNFWELLAYCAGTGGSCLIIGSAAGVAAMGMEKISFFWYCKYISGLAALGYLGGVLAYAVQSGVLF
jgi:Na+/H+ antiporter NhaD/arsenite permease-like protein